jgi:hypothetical protein
MFISKYIDLIEKLNIIEYDLKKKKIYIDKKKGEIAPKGKPVLTGTQGGTYYEGDENIPSITTSGTNNKIANSSITIPEARSLENIQNLIRKRMPIQAEMRNRHKIPGGEKYSDREWAIKGANIAYSIHKNMKLIQSSLSISKKFAKGNPLITHNYETIDKLTQHLAASVSRDIDQVYIYFGKKAGVEYENLVYPMLDQIREYKIKGMQLKEHMENHESIANRGFISHKRPDLKDKKARIADVMTTMPDRFKK